MSSEEIYSVSVLCGSPWAGCSMRSLFEQSEGVMHEIGTPPVRMAASDAGIGKRPGAYAWKRARIRDRSFDSMTSYELIAGESTENGVFSGWSSCVYGYQDRGVVICGWSSSLGEMVDQRMSRFVTDIGTLLDVDYGYIFRQEAWMQPILYAMGLLAHNGRYPNYTSTPYTTNVSQWRWKLISPQGGGILRDVYPVNLLGETIQRAPIGYTGQSLLDWLRSGPDGRGTVEEVDGSRVLWKPPIHRIPALREELFRAGRLFYWKFIKAKRRIPNSYGQTEPEPLYRPDLSVPWVAEGPTPEFLRAEFYTDKDPSLTW